MIFEYKLQVRGLLCINKMQSPNMRRMIKEDKALQILSFWKVRSSQSLWIRDIKTGVWKIQQEVPPWNTTILKTLKIDLIINHRILNILHQKAQTNDYIISYWEGVIIQSKFSDMGWEVIFMMNSMFQFIGVQLNLNRLPIYLDSSCI